MNVARQLVQGVDVWLNNPRRPQEASGTSGEKVVLNGALNFSILDGWWAEAYDGTNGFAIGIGQTHAVPSVQDERDHKALIETLTEQVVPLYYERDASGLPRELDRPAEERLPDPGLAVQRRPHGDGLRPAQLPAGGRRPVVRDAPVADRGSSGPGRPVPDRLGRADPVLDPERDHPDGIRASTADRRRSDASMSQALIGEKLGSFRDRGGPGLRRDGRGLPGDRRDDAGGRPPSRSSSGEIAQKGKVSEAVRARGRDPQAVPPPQHRPVPGAGASSGGRPTSRWSTSRASTLEKILQERGALPWREVVELAIQICDALHYAHEHGRRPPRPQAVEPDGHRRTARSS